MAATLVHTMYTNTMKCVHAYVLVSQAKDEKKYNKPNQAFASITGRADTITDAFRMTTHCYSCMNEYARANTIEHT